MTTNDAQGAPESNPDWMDVPTFVTNKEVTPKQTPKLTPKDVCMIRRSKSSYSDLAFIHGVSEATIKSVKRRRTWRDVE